MFDLTTPMKSATQLLVLVPFFSAALSASTLGPIGSATSDAISNGNALNIALTGASPGDTILLTAGAVFQGPFQLTQKSQPAPPAYITIRTSTPDCLNGASCLLTGTRVGPKDVSLLATLVPPPSGTSSDSVITTAQSAGYYHLVGLEITTNRYLSSLVTLGTWTETSWQQLPHHITFDRCYIHGSHTNGTRAGIYANAGQGTSATSGNPGNTGAVGSAQWPADDIVVTNSFIAEIKVLDG